MALPICIDCGCLISSLGDHKCHVKKCGEGEAKCSVCDRKEDPLEKPRCVKGLEDKLKNKYLSDVDVVVIYVPHAQELLAHISSLQAKINELNNAISLLSPNK